MRNKWKNGAHSPVLFFIDDLCNKWVDLNGDGKIQSEEDWGYAGFDNNGIFNFLEYEILSVNPEIKTTFFVPVGKRTNLITYSKINSVSEPINETEKSKHFLKTLHNDERFEIAYHGTTHGISGKEVKDFIQEWESYKSLEEALETINQGKEIFKEVTEEYPIGGKYCGYISNEFSDDSIDQTGFKWWCRYYNKGIEKENCLISGEDNNPQTAYDIAFFGKNNVIDIPTTIPGSIATINYEGNFLRKMVKRILKKYFIKKKLKQIDYLLKNNLVISIQEHISPSRVDCKRQTPNIIDDKESLKVIFKYLKKKNVWYCTGSELAEWVKENK